MNLKELLKFDRIGGVKVIPVSFKIVVILSIFIVVSNITTNYASLVFSRINQVYFTKQLLIKDLKDISNYSNVQWQIYELNKDAASAIRSIRDKSLFELKNEGSAILGFKDNGEVVFSTFDENEDISFNEKPIFSTQSLGSEKVNEDYVVTDINGKKYFGIYKYNQHWDMYIFRAEEEDAFYESSWHSFFIIIVVIFFITVFSAVTGSYIIRYILRFISVITESIMDMTQKQKLVPIPLKGAPNDDVTYMGMSFNVLSRNMDMLVNIFKKFTDRDIVKKAYTNKEVRLEGEQRNLTMLFTDIKGYTHMTETLGTDIIKLLNIQYDHAIESIYKYDGAIASIIGDALLAVYGVMESDRNKSHAALLSSFEVIDATRNLQEKMKLKKAELLEQHGRLTEEEEAIYQAVLVDVGIGIDMGDVFYGTIGSQLRMTTTVIGDKVNAAARLEGLTRIYDIPVICSGAVRDDVLSHVDLPLVEFIKIDQVQVKGKSEAIEIYWPVHRNQLSDDFLKEIEIFHVGLPHYFSGDWKQANTLFQKCSLPLAKTFIERTQQDAPVDWEGIWVLTSK
ncbi:MAG: adenylate/guanylate cyclase domain-containing protein [Neptuniibacter sp.]